MNEFLHINMMKVSNFFNNGFISTIPGTSLAYNLFDEGLAKFFCLETLRHGTSSKNYLSIYLNGVDPKLGGNSKGIFKLVNISKHRNYFYVFRDTEFMKRSHKTYKIFFGRFYFPKIKILPSVKKLTFLQRIKKITSPRAYALFSGFSHALNSKKNKSLRKIFIWGMAGILTPTVKLRFTLDDVHKNMREYRDDDFNTAYRTSKSIGLKHIGIIGTLSQGINLNMFSRMAANPLKVINGIALMTLSYFVTSCFILEATFYNQLINSSSFLYGIDKITKIALYSMTILGIS